MTDAMKEAADALGPEQTYFQLLNAGSWMLPQCAQCHRFCFYPRLACPSCRGQRFDWVRPSGGGIVYSSTVMRRPAEAGGDVNLCLIDLDEGVRMMSRVVGTGPEQVKIGDRVRAVTTQAGETGKVYFEIAEQNR